MSEMGVVIVEYYGVEVMNILIGFKYIGEKMNQFEVIGSYIFLFGYEESYGYLVGSYVCDKDVILVLMFIVEVVVYYKN